MKAAFAVRFRPPVFFFDPFAAFLAVFLAMYSPQPVPPTTSDAAVRPGESGPVPPKPDAARAGNSGRDERDYRPKIVFRTEEIVHRRSLCERREHAHPPSRRTRRPDVRAGDTSNPIDHARRGLPDLQRPRTSKSIAGRTLVTDSGGLVGAMRIGQHHHVVGSGFSRTSPPMRGAA